MKKLSLVLFSLLVWTTLAKDIGFVERKQVDVHSDGENWSFSRDYDLAAHWEDARKELELDGRFMQHPEAGHIRGMNGDAVIRLSMPYSVDTIKAYGVVTNYADSVQRRYSLSYSLDGIRYKILSEKSQAVGACRLEGEAKLPGNRGIVYLRYQRIIDEKDDNGKSGYVLWGNFGFELGGGTAVRAADNAIAKKSKRLKNVFPTGVFWPWERTYSCANYAKMELWAFVDKTMKLLKENGYDTVWFVNISNKDNMLKVLSIAEENGMQVLLNTDLLHIVYNGASSLEGLENMAWSTYKTLGASDALLGYVLKDEPQLFETENMSTFYNLMREVDPSRDSVAVVMNRQSLTYLRDSALPVVCSDIYYFGSENSTQLPTPKESQREFTLVLSCYGKAAETYGKHAWFMGQMFGDAWGRHWRKGDKLVVEPGTYLHWKMPTDAESRWQIWEALRLNTKGVFFYVLLPPIQLEVPPSEATEDWQKRRLENMDRNAAVAASWEGQKLLEKQIEIDPGEGMLDMDGTPRPQMLATAPIMRMLRKHEQRLARRSFSKIQLFYAGDEKTDTMTFASDGKHIGVIVNRDLLNRRTAKVLLLPNAQAVINLATDTEIPMKAFSEDFKEIELDLDAGDGALLELKFSGRPGICLLSEDFSRNSQFRLSIGKNAHVITIESMGADFKRALALKGKADQSEPVCTLMRLTSPKTGNTVALNMNRTRKSGTIYCQVNGSLNGCKVRAVTDETGGAKDNFMHLKTAESYDVGGSGEGFVIQDKEFFRPAVVPVGTSGLEFYLDSPDDMITDVALWFVPALE